MTCACEDDEPGEYRYVLDINSGAFWYDYTGLDTTDEIASTYH